MAKRRISLTPRVRFALSVLLIGHLLAVFAPPLAFQTRGPLGPSPVVATVLASVADYGEFLYLNRGYAFFAPDPGPSHLIQAAIVDPEGRMVEQMYPDLDQQWPRLLYHRHFMLSEYLNEIYQPPGPPAELVELDPVEADYWRRARARYEHVRLSVVNHLKHRHPGHEVAIRRIEHLIPEVGRFRRGSVTLDDPESYRVIPDQPLDLGNEPAGNAPADVLPKERAARETASP